LLAVLLLSSIGLRIINPQILRHFIDTATSDGTAQALTQIAVFFLSVAVINQLLSVATAYVSENVGWIATNQLRADLALHCLNLDMSFHTTHTPGELIERIDGDVNDLANFFSQFVIQVVGNLLLILGVLVALFLENYWVGIGLALYVVVTLIVLSRLWPLSVTHMAALREIEAQLSSFFEERLAGTEDIGANDGWSYSIRCMLQLSREEHCRWFGHWRNQRSVCLVQLDWTGIWEPPVSERGHFYRYRLPDLPLRNPFVHTLAPDHFADR
jgi:ABC-type multidrug transport system fused ATPase/permease subunit